MLIPPLLLGGLLLFAAPHMKAEPEKSALKTNKKVVRVLSIKPRQIQPMVVGYGHTAPVDEWQAQSSLEGNVVWIDERLKSGERFSKGSELVKIDPSNYRLSIAKIEAELEVVAIKDDTIRASVTIAEQEVDILQQEYQRSLRLSNTGHVSQTAKDSAQRALLNSQQQLQTLKNNLRLNRAEAQVLTTQLALAEYDLSQTVVRAPFDLRITEQIVSLAEYANRGELLFKADGTERIEVNAQFPLGKMRPLRKSTQATSFGEQAANLHSELSAVVELRAGERIMSWPAYVARSGGIIDAQTQSQTIVVQVDNPYQQASPGIKPPLVRNTFVKVTLKAPVLDNQFLLPVNALHTGANSSDPVVYLVDKEGKLAIRPVKVDFIQGEVAVIRSGITQGDKVVLSQISPAVNGMALKPIADKKTNAWLDKVTGFSSKEKKAQAGGDL